MKMLIMPSLAAAYRNASISFNLKRQNVINEKRLKTFYTPRLIFKTSHKIRWRKEADDDDDDNVDYDDDYVLGGGGDEEK